jgi:hypothetical protein
MTSIRQAGASDAKDAVDDLIHEIGSEAVAFFVAHDIEEVVVKVVPHPVLDVLALGPVHHPPAGDNIEHGFRSFGGVGAHVARLGIGRCKLLLNGMVERNPCGIVTKMFWHVVVAGVNHLFARIADDVEEFKLRDTLRPVIVDGLLRCDPSLGTLYKPLLLSR